MANRGAWVKGLKLYKPTNQAYNCLELVSSCDGFTHLFRPCPLLVITARNICFYHMSGLSFRGMDSPDGKRIICTCWTLFLLAKGMSDCLL